ncbi:MAG: FecR domain-containing protein [Bacteroidetes bacterium]|nr:FecR domain-containing protein [Bacteroidota bacterium]
MELENIDDLIAKVLAGEASEKEISTLNAWRNVSDENRVYVTQSEEIFHQIHSVRLERKVDVNRAWKDLNEKISTPEIKKISWFNSKTIIRIAALFIILLGAALTLKLLNHDNAQSTMQVVASNTSVLDTLPDGSTVFLNKKSTITYSLNADNIREVHLSGEAFFNVVHNKEQAFEIVIDGVRVKDIGTAFNVKALPGSNEVEVVVEEGEVQFFTNDNQGLNLIKGQKAQYNLNTKLFSQSVINVNENALSYRTKEFHFSESTLKEVVQKLNDVYACDIRLYDDKIANCKVSVVFKNEDLEMILSVLSETLDLKIERKENHFLLKGESCSEI